MDKAVSVKFLLLFCWTTQAEEMSSLEAKMTDIMDRVTRMEAEMIAKDQRIAVLEDAMKTRDVQLCEVDEEMKNLAGRLTVTEEVRNTPFVFQCAWKEGPWTGDHSVITYDRLTSDEMSGGDGGLDINTGVFTVGQGLSGVWAVTFSIKSVEENGEHNQAWVGCTLYSNECGIG